MDLVVISLLALTSTPPFLRGWRRSDARGMHSSCPSHILCVLSVPLVCIAYESASIEARPSSVFLSLHLLQPRLVRLQCNAGLAPFPTKLPNERS